MCLVSQECSDFEKGTCIYCILYDIPRASILSITHVHFCSKGRNINTRVLHRSYKKSPRFVQVQSCHQLSCIKPLLFRVFENFRIADKGLWTYIYTIQKRSSLSLTFPYSFKKTIPLCIPIDSFKIYPHAF